MHGGKNAPPPPKALAKTAQGPRGHIFIPALEGFPKKAGRYMEIPKKGWILLGTGFLFLCTGHGGLSSGLWLWGKPRLLIRKRYSKMRNMTLLISAANYGL